MSPFCTIVSASHRPQALALAESLRRTQPDPVLYILVVDSEPHPNPPPPSHVRWIGLADLGHGYPRLMPFYFDAFEFCNALKPFLVTHLLDAGLKRVIYLDCDIMAVGSFAATWRRLDKASVILTPHVTTPPAPAESDAAELMLVDLGVYNGGFAAWADTPAARAMLRWMCDRLPTVGFCAPEWRMFCDQKLLPLLKQYYPEEVDVWRDPTLNIAYWNARERAVACDHQGWSIDGRPVVFFHLSGFALTAPTLPCKYHTAEENARRLAEAPWLAAVLAEYADLWRQFLPKDAAPSYGFRYYDQIRLTEGLRRLLHRRQRFNRWSVEFWRIRLTEHLRLLKRAFIAWRRARASSPRPVK